MKKVVLSILVLLGSIGTVFSQFDAQLSQYMFHNSAFNPAAVGEGNMIQITGQHRIQWVGIPNAGQTTVFSVNTPIKLGNTTHGVGLNFLNENIGLFTNQAAHLQYAYKKHLAIGVLSFGADFGFISLGFKSDSVHTISLAGYHDITGDPEIPKSAVVGMSFDMNLGAFFSFDKGYAGISYLHLNSPIVKWGDNTEFKQSSAFFFTGGYSQAFSDPKYVLKPTMLVKTDFKSLQFDLTARMEYDSKYWGGLTYRLQDAVVFLAGINIAGGLSIGYSYDLPTSKILSVSSGSHEFLMTYSFEYVFGKSTSKYKSIRIL